MKYTDEILRPQDTAKTVGLCDRQIEVCRAGSSHPQSPASFVPQAQWQESRATAELQHASPEGRHYKNGQLKSQQRGLPPLCPLSPLW